MVSLGKSAVSHGTASRQPGAVSPEIDATNAIHEVSKNVQNRDFKFTVASLLSSLILMPENNYPQTYPRLEDMLVNTNIELIRGGTNLGRNETTPQTVRFWGVVARLGLADGKLGFPDLERANFGRLRSFRTILDFEFDFLPFVQAAIAAALDGGKVCENIGTAGVRRDETVTLVSVEPLNFALLSHFPSVL